MEGPWNATQWEPSNAYRYNGKELNSDLGLDWYDYGARMYDAGIARWGTVDPLAEKYLNWSAYNYVMGNPVRLVDPDGMSTSLFERMANQVGMTDEERQKRTGEWRNTFSTLVESNTEKSVNSIDSDNDLQIKEITNPGTGDPPSENKKKIQGWFLSLDISTPYLPLFGIGFELGVLSDGEYTAPYFTYKRNLGISLGVGAGLIDISPLHSNGIKLESLAGSGGETSIGVGPFGYSHFVDRTDNQFGSATYPDNLRSTYYGQTLSLNLGFPVTLAGSSTQTYVSTPRKIKPDPILRMKMGGL